jgi:hypothetical protein
VHFRITTAYKYYAISALALDISVLEHEIGFLYLYMVTVSLVEGRRAADQASLWIEELQNLD